MNENFKDIISAALSGDETAYEALYTMTKDSAYFVALSVTHNEQDALDILQESYIKAFAHLDTVDPPEYFDNWLNRIVSNCSKNFIKRKKPILFSDISENIHVEELNEETDISLIPHEHIDKQEASRLIMEIINGLSENKRLVILMYYYQEMSTKEISEALELPLTTVKYYLLESRKQIKSELEKLDKEGTRLYAAIPFSLFPSLIGLSAEEITGPAFSTVSTAVMGTVNGSASSAATAHAASSEHLSGGINMLFKTTASKIIAAVAAVAVVGGGIAAIIAFNNNNQTGSVEGPQTSNENHIGFQSGTEGTAAVSSKPEENENWDKYYDYRIEDNGVVITKYIGSDKEIVIPDSIEGKPVVKIEKPESGYFGKANLPTSVTIPDTVTEIGDFAFAQCKALATINIPDSVTDIGTSAFHGTKWYNDQPDGLVYIGKVAYVYKGDMPENTSIDLKADTVGIASNAFKDCETLVSINLPDGIKTIGEGAFTYCKGLKSIDIPDSISKIKEYAFTSCTGLEKISVPDKAIEIREYAFLTTAWLKSQPDGLIYLGKTLYGYHGNLHDNKEIVIKDDTKSIAERALSGAFNVKSIEIPASVEFIGIFAFEGCTGLSNISVDSGNKNYVAVDGALFNKDKTKIMFCSPKKEGTYSIPDSVTKIEHGTFFKCDKLTNIIIPKSVKEIGNTAFDDCRALTSIDIPESVEKIGTAAFQDCKSLTSITIPKSITELPDGLFYECEKLQSITIPESVTSIGDKVFDGCHFVLQLHVKSGSYAEKYAKQNSFNFVAE